MNRTILPSRCGKRPVKYLIPALVAVLTLGLLRRGLLARVESCATGHIPVR